MLCPTRILKLMFAALVAENGLAGTFGPFAKDAPIMKADGNFVRGPARSRVGCLCAERGTGPSRALLNPRARRTSYLWPGTTGSRMPARLLRRPQDSTHTCLASIRRPSKRKRVASSVSERGAVFAGPGEGRHAKLLFVIEYRSFGRAAGLGRPSKRPTVSRSFTDSFASTALAGVWYE